MADQPPVTLPVIAGSPVISKLAGDARLVVVGEQCGRTPGGRTGARCRCGASPRRRGRSRLVVAGRGDRIWGWAAQLPRRRATVRAGPRRRTEPPLEGDLDESARSVAPNAGACPPDAAAERFRW